MIHTIALILLTTGTLKKVHLVYCNEGLMTRDKDDFASFWELAGFVGNVIYQVSIDFEREATDFLIIDESDSLIFDDPVVFRSMLAKIRCICFTATPDDNDPKGAEK
jgi:hypothetical protein